MDIVIQQVLLQHLSRSGQEIAVAPLAPELERKVGGRVRAVDVAVRRSTYIRSDDNLAIPFDAFDKGRKIRRGAESWELRIGRHS
jgi:hypothetical protein